MVIGEGGRKIITQTIIRERCTGGGGCGVILNIITEIIKRYAL